MDSSSCEDVRGSCLFLLSGECLYISLRILICNRPVQPVDYLIIMRWGNLYQMVRTLSFRSMCRCIWFLWFSGVTLSVKIILASSWGYLINIHHGVKYTDPKGYYVGNRYLCIIGLRILIYECTHRIDLISTLCPFLCVLFSFKISSCVWVFESPQLTQISLFYFSTNLFFAFSS